MANSYSSLDEQLAILHGQVTQALMLTNFSCTAGTREVIEAVVHRTRTKVRMLGGVPDSSLAMMAVQVGGLVAAVLLAECGLGKLCVCTQQSSLGRTWNLC